MSPSQASGTGRRLLDVTAASVMLGFLSPLLAILALLCRLLQGAPVLHRDVRAGLDEQPFMLLKLRTMTDARNASGHLLPDDQRLTRLGRVLRSASLDELPQLWNVLRGDMALVGPRPLPTTYLPRYTEAERRRHSVRPGITGWAQVHGRNDIAWDERLALDTWYVDHRSLGLDLRIVARTVGLVVRRDGISAAGEATMGELRPERAESA